jgi:hypothetical protein
LKYAPVLVLVWGIRAKSLSQPAWWWRNRARKFGRSNPKQVFATTSLSGGRPMKLKHLAVLAIASLLVSACSPIKHSNIDDTQNIPAGEGVIVARVILEVQSEGAAEPKVLLTAGQHSFTGLATHWFFIALHPGENFSVQTVPAGQYSWIEFWVQGKKSDFKGRLPFDVEPGKINYVGDIVLSIDMSDPWHYGMRVTSDLPAAGRYLQFNYPQLASRYPLVPNLTVDNR